MDKFWLLRQAVAIAGILFFGLLLGQFITQISLPAPRYYKLLIVDTIEYTTIITSILYAIRKGTN